MTCPDCIGGYVRKFKARTETEKALFYDEICPTCNGQFIDKFEIPDMEKKKETETVVNYDDIPF